MFPHKAVLYETSSCAKNLRADTSVKTNYFSKTLPCMSKVV